MEEEDDFDLENELERELEAGMDLDEGASSLSLLLSAHFYSHGTVTALIYNQENGNIVRGVVESPVNTHSCL